MHVFHISSNGKEQNSDVYTVKLKQSVKVSEVRPWSGTEATKETKPSYESAPTRDRTRQTHQLM